MNFIYKRRLDFRFLLSDNVDKAKLINSINLLSKKNKIIKLTNTQNKPKSKDKNLYISIEGNVLLVNFSHLFYDAFSINYVLQKIDEIYHVKDENECEIVNYEFNCFVFKVNFLQYFLNNLKILYQIGHKSAYAILTKKNKKTIKILKEDFKTLTNGEIINCITKRLNIEQYCLVVNARKIYPEYENFLGNLIYVSSLVKQNEEIGTILKKDSNTSLEKLLNTTPKSLWINSYLNFLLPSFIKSLIINNNTFGNKILIYPLNSDEKYIILDYYY